MKEEILSFFNTLNDKNINYFVLRDYYDINNIYYTKDIDLYVSKDSKKIINKLLKEKGWYTPTINDNKYPHKQYYKIINKKIVKIDIVFGLFFGEKNYYLDAKINKIKNFEMLKSIKIPEKLVALESLILHIIYDKRMISKKNTENLKYMLEQYKKSDNFIENDFYRAGMMLLQEPVDQNIKNLDIYYKMLKRYIKNNSVKNILINLRRKINIVRKKFFVKFSKRNIAFIGVDGSGKSSIINNINNIFDGKSKIVYMGEKNYKIKKLGILLKKKNCNIVEKLIRRILIVVEPFYRYYASRYRSEIILFDRYVDDIFINKPTVFNKIIFRILFPKSKIKIYLCCDLNESFKRKDDILDREVFSKMKNRYDNYYHNKNILIIDTSKYSIDESIQMVVNIINEKYPYYML